MQIKQIKINHIERPLGYYFYGSPVVSFKIENSDNYEVVEIYIEVYEKCGERITLSNGENEFNTIISSEKYLELKTVYPLPIKLKPRTEYMVTIKAINEIGELATEGSYFETGKMDECWQGKWIAPENEEIPNPQLSKKILIRKSVKSARAYVGCSGLYRLMINDKKVGKEFLTPYCNDYHSWRQIITHDITDYLHIGENLLSFTLAKGWFMGSFSLTRSNNIYGHKMSLITELHVEYTDGERQVFCSDDSWMCTKSEFEKAEIYDGAVMNYRISCSEYKKVCCIEIDNSLLMDRLSMPVLSMETISVQRVFKTPKGELCLDMGQNMVGLFKLNTSNFPEHDIKMSFFEVLDQDGNVYKDNLRTAKQEFTYYSDGVGRILQPEFTYYGFRYVVIEGLEEIEPDAFTGIVIYSKMDKTGKIETSNELINKLFQNAMWSQKGNFVDLPTDCPQRDERLGYTGDAQIFCGTALYNMNAISFFDKYLFDIRQEQKKHNGAVPVFVPTFITQGSSSVAAMGIAGWGDAATIIPWTCYIHTGDDIMLRRHYPLMRDWVEYIYRQDTGNHLWDSSFQFGDWLSLDMPENNKFGLTPEILVASSFYLQSVELTAKAANILGFDKDCIRYTSLAEEIRKAIRYEFISPSGRVASDSQTADVLALKMGFAINNTKTVNSLVSKIKNKWNGHLSTGFIGTAYLCSVLSENGCNEQAYDLLTRQDYPGWLYEVKKGATTIWERWDSISCDGSLADPEMNSFNHYANAAIIEWLYKYAAGLQPIESAPGFRKIKYSPKLDARLGWLKASYDSISGQYISQWEITDQGLIFFLVVPLGCEAELDLPDVPDFISVNKKSIKTDQPIKLAAGEYHIYYQPTNTYFKQFTLDTDIKEVRENSAILDIIIKHIPEYADLGMAFHAMTEGSLRQVLNAADIKIDKRLEDDIISEMASVRI